jgi:adenylate cyclase
LSGNKRLEIRPEAPNRAAVKEATDKKVLSDFSNLSHIRVLGLMDVTTTFLEEIPAESEDRRVRTSPSEFNGFMYGIADTLGRSDHLSMFDLVKPEFRNKKNETVFAMFGRAQPFDSNNKLSKFLHDNFLLWFQRELSSIPAETPDQIPHVFRRTFLRLNKATYDFLCQSALMSRKLSAASSSTSTTAMRELAHIRGGASGVVVYVVDKTMYVANAGNALAVVSRGGQPLAVSRKHDPFDREETTRIRAAEGWVSQRGFVNDEIDLSRSFGFYHLSPMVNPRPDVTVHTLDETDEFVIIGNRGLWDYVSYQTAVDIARTARGEPMIAAQKLRDFAMAYGAEGSIMIMVVTLGGLFRTSVERARKTTAGALPDLDSFLTGKMRPRRKDINDVEIARLDDEVPPPVGHLALTFTDIRNSTMLWEANNGAMATAIRVHNKLLRRWLRNCGGYEVKTEGDAFMCSFPTALNALWWCLRVQVELLSADWPKEILNSDEGRELYNAEGKLIHRGLSVRMGIHVGTPTCEPDPVTGRMDYFGPMVNRSARINGRAGGGQIFCSADVAREIDAKIFENGPETEYSWAQPPVAIAAIKQIGVSIINKGAFQLKGLEGAEVLSVVYPADLIGREALLDLPEGIPTAIVQAPVPATVSRTHVQLAAEELRALALLAVRLEALASARVFKHSGARKASSVKSTAGSGPDANGGDGATDTVLPVYLLGDADALVPSLNPAATDDEVLLVLGSLAGRVENALAALTLGRIRVVGGGDELAAALERRGGLDGPTLERLLAVLEAA